MKRRVPQEVSEESFLEDSVGEVSFPSGDFDLARSVAGCDFVFGGDEAGEALASALSALSRPARALPNHQSFVLIEMPHGGLIYLKVLTLFFASCSFFSFCIGGVLTRLEAPESSPRAMLRGFLVLDPRALLNIEVGPNVVP